MSDIVHDDGIVERMRRDLRTVREEFETAHSSSDEVAAAVGHDELAARVRAFAGNWENRRRDLVEQITTVEGQLATLQEEFGAQDDALASGVKASAR